MKKTTLVATLVLAGAWSIGLRAAYAQSPAQPAAAIGAIPDTSGEDIKLFRKDVRAMRKQLFAANLELTGSEAEKFWPIFDRYTVELVKVMDRKYALLQEYGQNYNSLTDEQAESYIKGRAEVEDSIMKIRMKYFPIFRNVVSGRTTALFFQLDWRLGALIDLQLASQTPLIEP